MKLACTTLILATSLATVQAAPIPGIISTTAPGGTYILGAHPVGSGTTAQPTNPHPSWVSAPSGSGWISAVPDSNTNSTGLTQPPGTYDFNLSFDLNGFDPGTVKVTGQFSADNFAEILLNGVSTGETTGYASPHPISGREAYRQLTAFTLDGSLGFLAGANILTFRVTNDVINNSDNSGNPFGLLVSITSATAGLTPTPEPASLALWGLLASVVGVCLVVRRRRFIPAFA